MFLVLAKVSFSFPFVFVCDTTARLTTTDHFFFFFSIFFLVQFDPIRILFHSLVSPSITPRSRSHLAAFDISTGLLLTETNGPGPAAAHCSASTRKNRNTFPIVEKRIFCDDDDDDDARASVYTNTFDRCSLSFLLYCTA